LAEKGERPSGGKPRQESARGRLHCARRKKRIFFIVRRASSQTPKEEKKGKEEGWSKGSETSGSLICVSEKGRLLLPWGRKKRAKLKGKSVNGSRAHEQRGGLSSERKTACRVRGERKAGPLSSEVRSKSPLQWEKKECKGKKGTMTKIRSLESVGLPFEREALQREGRHPAI